MLLSFSFLLPLNKLDSIGQMYLERVLQILVTSERSLQ